jgi:TonB family protein
MRNKKCLLKNLFPKSDTQPSLFHYIKEKPDPGVFDNMDWSFLTHPIHALKESWHSPRTKPSLFHYINEEQKRHLTFSEFFSDMFTGFRNPLLIPSVFGNPAELALERSQSRTRKCEAGMVSAAIHILVLALFLGLAATRLPKTPNSIENGISVPINTQMLYWLPPPAKVLETGNLNPASAASAQTGPGNDDREGGGGGGGGKGERTPPSPGRMAATLPIQQAPPAPGIPRISLPADDDMPLIASIQMPINIPQDMRIDIGVPYAPPTAVKSSGQGAGGGNGNGKGTGTGDGEGPGFGPGKDGGMGGGEGGGIGKKKGPYALGGSGTDKGLPGLKEPRILIQPLPPYTEEARKQHIEGEVNLQAVILKDGTVTSFKIIKGLGYGLDNSAISTISSKWRFDPGTLNGAPVDVIVNINVRFRLY